MVMRLGAGAGAGYGAWDGDEVEEEMFSSSLKKTRRCIIGPNFNNQSVILSINLVYI